MNTVKLADVAIESRESLKEKDNTLPVVGLEHIIPEEINLTEWDIGVENTFTKTFQKGDVLFGRRRAYLKKAAVAPCEGICSGDITVIRAKEDKIIPELLPFIIQNDEFFDYAVGKSAGSLSPRVKWEHLANYEFNLPAIEEQKKLADTLWQIVATMESYKKLLAKTDEMVKAKFVEMFGDLKTNEKKITIKHLSDVCDVRDGTHDSPKFYSEGCLFLTSKNFSNGYLDLSEVQYISKEDFDKYNKRSKVDKGDIVMPMIGTIGHPVIIDVEPNFAIKNVALIKFNKSSISNIYVKTIFESEYFKTILYNKNRGGTQKFISLTDIRDFNIPIPPIELQDQFAEFIKKTEESKSSIQASLDSLTKVYKKIIAENLGGIN